MQQASNIQIHRVWERNIQNLKTCGSEVCRWRAWAWGTLPYCRRARIPTGLVSCLLSSLFSRSLMKGGSWSPSLLRPSAGNLLQWLKTVQLSSWVMGDSFFTLLQGHVGWGDRKGEQTGLWTLVEPWKPHHKPHPVSSCRKDVETTFPCRPIQCSG